MSFASAYLDASAAVKLMVHEPETAALRAMLSDIPNRLSSVLLDVELRCVAHRVGGGELVERARRICAGVDLLPYTPAIHARAGQPFSPPQRALDAIHLATALDLAWDELVVLTYDERQAAGATSAGLAVAAPS